MCTRHRTDKVPSHTRCSPASLASGVVCSAIVRVASKTAGEFNVVGRFAETQSATRFPRTRSSTSWSRHVGHFEWLCGFSEIELMLSLISQRDT